MQRSRAQLGGDYERGNDRGAKELKRTMSMTNKQPVMRRITPLIMLAAAILATDPAAAASLANCPAEYQDLEASFPAGITEIWAETLQDDLNAVNALDDKDSLLQAQAETWAEFEAYQENPDPDGDGYAFAPEVVQGHAYLMNCLYVARGIEVEDAEEIAQSQVGPDEDNGADTDESLESPPTRIEGSEPWFTTADYPPSAQREERQGTVNYDLTIGADGKVLGCQASGPPDSDDLEMATCDAILARARFNPATDAAGHPATGEYSGSIRWSLPE